MRIFLCFLCILMFCHASSIMALPMQLDEVTEGVRQEYSMNISNPNIPRESHVSSEPLQTYTAYKKNQTFRNIEKQVIPPPKAAVLHGTTSKNTAQREIPLWEVLKYYKTLFLPDIAVSTKTSSSAYRFRKTSYAGVSGFQLTNYSEEISDLIKPYTITVESFNALRSILSDNSVLALKKSGEIVNLEPLLKPILLDDYTVASYDSDYAPQNGMVTYKRDSSRYRVFSIKELINKLIDIVSHPISITIYLVFLFFILPVMLVIRRNAK